MAHFKANLADLEFNLFEVNRIQDYLGTEPFATMDEPTARAILAEVARLAADEFAASFVDADRRGVSLEDGAVTLPTSLKQSLDAFYAGGWNQMGLPAHLGGFGAPPSLQWAANEMLVGANPTAYFYTIGTLMARVVDALGTDDQKAIARLMVERPWGGTMVLTEPDAGSDVGAGTTRAFHVQGDEYRLEGVKRFITSGDDDYHENIIHLVLARPEGAGPGTKGLSMFIVPKYHFDADGTIGEPNGIACTRIEDKMGLKASTTSELTLGGDRPCLGYLVGGKHGGIRQMFHVIEAARMLIGTKSASTLSTAYLNSLEFARERIQGADLTEAADKTAPRVPILRHPNVRRLLMLQKCHAEGMRALVFFTAWVQDQALLDPGDDHWHRLDDLLLPLVKGYSSEKAYELLGQSLQVLGGSGFTKDYPHEQYIRDAKIDTLYEGTTGIQALDLFFRKIARDRGETVTRLGARITEFVKGGAADDPLAAERDLLGQALEDVQSHLGVMVGHLMAAQSDAPEIYKVGLHATPLLDSLAEVVIGWLLLRHAEIALAGLADGSGDQDFYAGKVAAARFFAGHALPKVGLRRRAAEREDGALMALSEAAF